MYPHPPLLAVSVRSWWIIYRLVRRTHIGSAGKDADNNFFESAFARMGQRRCVGVRIGRFSFGRGFSIHRFADSEGHRHKCVDPSGHSSTVLVLPRQDGRIIGFAMANRTEPKTAWQWIRYIAVAGIAIWLVIWMLRLSGINIP